MKYTIDNKTFYTPEDVAEWISENLDQDLYDEFLDEIHGEVEICGYSYQASLALERVDPIAYRCGFSDFQDMVYSEVKDELDGTTGNYVTETVELYGYEIECEEDPEEEEEEEE